MGTKLNRLIASTLLASLLSTPALAAPSMEAIGDQIGLDFLRLLSIALTFGIGFGIGWLFSDKGKTFRKYVGLAILALIALNMLTSQSFISHGLSALVTMVAFFIGMSLGFGTIAKSLFGKPTTFGSAEWADMEHIKENDLIGTDGFRLGGFATKKESVQLSYKRDRHLLTVAPTRSGKGTTAIIPNLLTYEGSCLVIDPKGENALITAERRETMGQEVHIVDPWLIASDAGLKPARFNPLDWLEKGDVDITENAMLLADALVVKQGEGDQFWIEEAKALLQGFILYVATEESEAGQRHLGRVRDLLLLDGEDMPELFQRMTNSAHHIVCSTGARCLQKEEKLLANVIASAQAQTHFLDSARIRESLSASDFKFEDLKTKAMTIYLVLPSDRLNAFSRWLRLLIQQAITVNARNIELKPAKPVLFLLDEMPALGRLSMVEQAYGLMAGFGIQIWGIVQDLSQLKR
ncbi:MAG: type IV secretory system conjugative DNA transfer family protein, partial [Robiginitomaculum sp.]|nr:type IV secretory system conjugative DNA transfer family protein [Robiginitomaculum sp.]